MGTPDDAKQRAASTYNAASDFYDHPVNSFWEQYGQRTVSRLGLRPGSRILDVCSGSGASAIPAAEAVGPAGSVLGVDLAGNLLRLAERKAKDRGLGNVEFRIADMLALDAPAASFDTVICVFGIFFVPDMEQAVRELWRLVRPGGRLALTTWGPRFFEPVNTAFWNAVRAERPELHKGFNPWDRIAEPEALRALFESTGAEAPDIVPEMRWHPLRTPEDWWPMVMGTGYRGTVEQLGVDARERVRHACLDFIRSAGVGAVEANVLYGAATKRDSPDGLRRDRAGESI
jgi:ubiquinone/menaquinone biosynthesis C-methylase UbiE